MKNYICIEGADWSGKSTLAKLLVEHLNLKGPLKWHRTKEPGSPHVQACGQIRTIIIHNPQLSDWAYAGLFAADTRHHLLWVESMLSEPENGIVSDRCMVSDYGYRPQHGAFREENLKKFLNLDPVIIYLAASPETLTTRQNQRNDLNLFEKHHVVDRLDEIDRNYRDALLLFNHAIIDTDNKSPEEIMHEALYYIESLQSTEVDTEGCVIGTTHKKH